MSFITVNNENTNLNRCDFTVDDLQIVNAATHGAAAITLSPEMTDDLKSQVDLCKKHQLEPIVMIKNAEEGMFIKEYISYFHLTHC